MTAPKPGYTALRLRMQLGHECWDAAIHTRCVATGSCVQNHSQSLMCMSRRSEMSCAQSCGVDPRAERTTSQSTWGSAEFSCIRGELLGSKRQTHTSSCAGRLCDELCLLNPLGTLDTQHQHFPRGQSGSPSNARLFLDRTAMKSHRIPKSDI